MVTDTHPSLPEFEYIRPESPEEASKILTEHPDDACPFLGGTDIFVRLRDGHLKANYLVDIKHLDGTRDLKFDPQQGLSLGAAVSMNRVIADSEVQAHYPLLAEACRSVASYQLRTRATVVGNICNASPAGDTIGACLLLGGVLQIHGTSGSRQEPLDGFFKGPGKTSLKPGDIVTAIKFPLPPEKHASRYYKLGRNKLSDLSIVGAAAYGYPDPELASGLRLRLALASVAPVPLVVPAVEELLGSQPISEETIQEAAKTAAEACSPIDDVRGGAGYRKQMVRNLSTKVLQHVWEELK